MAKPDTKFVDELGSGGESTNESPGHGAQQAADQPGCACRPRRDRASHRPQVCGAEKLVGVWAEARGIPIKAYTPDSILGDGQPVGAVAFPGADPDLCTRAEALGIRVRRPYG